MSASTRRTLVRPSTIGTWVIAAIYGLPILWLVLTSLKSNIDIFRLPASPIFVPTLDAYAQLAQTDLPRALLNSSIIAITSTAGVLMLAVPAAYALARGERRIVTIGMAIVVVLHMIPQTSMVIPLYKVLTQWRLLGTLQGVIVANIAMLIPFAIIILIPFMYAVSKDIEEAASMDGANRAQVLVRIVLPLVANGIITVGLLVFIMSWGEFLYAISFLLDPRTYPVSAVLSQQIGEFGTNWNVLMALAIVTSLPIALLSVIGQRWLRNGLSMGAVK
jgi:multiple sugar transport system permease protein